MPRGNWVKYAEAFGLALTAIVAIAMYWAMFYDMGLQSGHHGERAHIEREHHIADASKQIQENCAGMIGSALRECITKIVEAERESRRSESGLAAQWQAADWVLWASKIAGMQLIATIAGLYFVKRTLDATLDAVEATGKATEAMVDANIIASDTAKRSLRAYCVADGCVVEEMPFVNTIGAEEVGKFIVVQIINCGESPAYQAGGWVRTYSFSKQAGKLSKIPRRRVLSRGVVGPGKSAAVFCSIHEPANSHPDDDSLFVSGIFGYRDAFGVKRVVKFRFVMEDTLLEFVPSARGNYST